MKRLIANILVITSIAVLPWWLGVIMIALMLMYFDFFEVIIYGLILDAMYGRPGSSISAHSFFVGALLVYIIIILVKPHLRNTN